MRRELRVFVAGVPVPKGSLRAFALRTGRVVTTNDSPKTKPWQSVVQLALAQGWDHDPTDESCYVSLIFRVPRPKALRKKLAAQAVKKPDVDKLARLVLDAATGVVWRDDSQVTTLHARKEYERPDYPPGVDVVVVVETAP